MIPPPMMNYEPMYKCVILQYVHIVTGIHNNQNVMLFVTQSTH